MFRRPFNPFSLGSIATVLGEGRQPSWRDYMRFGSGKGWKKVRTYRGFATGARECARRRRQAEVLAIYANHSHEHWDNVKKRRASARESARIAEKLRG